MVQPTGRRGRPKGTGIDDGDRIARLAELIRVRPDLKPTTAIRLMGFSDPSAIRRLRDKYKLFVATVENPSVPATPSLLPIKPAFDPAPDVLRPVS